MVELFDIVSELVMDYLRPRCEGCEGGLPSEWHDCINQMLPYHDGPVCYRIVHHLVEGYNKKNLRKNLKRKSY